MDWHAIRVSTELWWVKKKEGDGLKSLRDNDDISSVAVPPCEPVLYFKLCTFTTAISFLQVPLLFLAGDR